MAKGNRGLVWAGVVLAGMLATGGAVLAQTSEMHTQGHQCRNIRIDHRLDT